jgi:hypothetical protein
MGNSPIFTQCPSSGPSRPNKYPGSDTPEKDRVITEFTVALPEYTLIPMFHLRFLILPSVES